MSETNGDESSSDTESFEEEIEPKLKYERLLNDLQSILLKSSATCIAVHHKFILLGSHWGAVHILDHQGTSVQEDLKGRTVTVNQISVDNKGEFLATCSDDGKIVVHGLFSKDSNISFNVCRLVKTIALDPNYAKGGFNRRFITGDNRLTLYEKTFLGGLKPTVLCESEGLVRALSWGEKFIAWASDIGVRIYDIEARCSLGLIKWEEHPSISIDKFRCNLRWSDSRTLLIGWVDTVRVCIIRKRSTMELQNKDLPRYLVDPVSTFRTKFYICGIAPLDQQLVLLGYPKHLSANKKSLRPKLYIFEYCDNNYTDICADSLSLRGYEEYKVNDYHLDVLIEENRFFIVAPKDIVVACPYDVDDRIQWLIKHSKFEEALDIFTQTNSREIHKYTMESVGIAYLDHLLARRMYDTAGKLCMKIFGKNKALWEEEIFKFATVHQLRSVSQYIPKSVDCKLDPHIYEMVLYEYLKMDSQGFLQLVKDWPPDLYNTAAVTNAVLEHLLICNTDKEIYLESLAMLYSYEKKYDKSLSTYLSLRNKDVFALIEKHKLHAMIYDMIVELMQLDSEKAIALLLDNKIPPEVVVSKLKDHERLLYNYLHAYDKTDCKGKYHGELVRLYAIFDKEKLLPFLKRSDHYHIQEALEVCQKAKYYKEMVYLLGRIGDTKEALELIMTELKDMHYAISFCQEHDDPDLWNDLIQHSLNKPEFITFLLQSIGTYIDPTPLVEQIKPKTEIPGLKNALVKMLHQYNLQVLVQEDCKKILVSDYFNLHKKLVTMQQKGVAISEEMVCGACHRKIMTNDASKATNVIIFNCKHGFHERCTVDTDNCSICNSNKRKS